MRPRSQSNAGPSGLAGLVLLMLSGMACFYIAGRLYQDARMRLSLIDFHERLDKDSEAVATDSVVKLSDLKEKDKQLAALELELAEARAAGFSSSLQLANATAAGKKRLLVVVGINTGFGQRPRRESIRNTWMPKGAKALQRLEDEKGVVVRFVVGTSANKGDSLDRQIAEENKETGDFMILVLIFTLRCCILLTHLQEPHVSRPFLQQDHAEGYDELPIKTQLYFTQAIKTWDADFYFKVDDDVYLNIDRLSVTLAGHAEMPRVYIGCMKSGEIFTDANQKWHEPEFWKFGDSKMYFRHATGQVYGLTKAVAQHIAINRQLLHRYRNEDVSLGSWMIGLDVEYIDDRAMCCASPQEGGEQEVVNSFTSDCRGKKVEGLPCTAVFDWACSGLCNSVERMPTLHEECGTKQLWES